MRDGNENMHRPAIIPIVSQLSFCNKSAGDVCAPVKFGGGILVICGIFVRSLCSLFANCSCFHGLYLAQALHSNRDALIYFHFFIPPDETIFRVLILFCVCDEKITI